MTRASRRNTLPKRTLGNSGLDVSALGLGYGMATDTPVAYGVRNRTPPT